MKLPLNLIDTPITPSAVRTIAQAYVEQFGKPVEVRYFDLDGNRRRLFVGNLRQRTDHHQV
jgi:hypothetical protein